MDTHFEFLIRRPADEVFADLADPDRFTARHPVIYRMERKGPGRFTVFEKLKLGPLGLPFAYPATIQTDMSSRTLRIDAVVHGLVGIEVDMTVIPEGAHCVLREQLRIRSSLPVKSRLSLFIRQQHAVMCKNLEKAHG